MSDVSEREDAMSVLSDDDAADAFDPSKKHYCGKCKRYFATLWHKCERDDGSVVRMTCCGSNPSSRIYTSCGGCSPETIIQQLAEKQKTQTSHYCGHCDSIVHKQRHECPDNDGRFTSCQGKKMNKDRACSGCEKDVSLKKKPRRMPKRSETGHYCDQCEKTTTGQTHLCEAHNKQKVSCVGLTTLRYGVRFGKVGRYHCAGCTAMSPPPPVALIDTCDKCGLKFTTITGLKNHQKGCDGTNISRRQKAKKVQPAAKRAPAPKQHAAKRDPRKRRRDDSDSDSKR